MTLFGGIISWDDDFRVAPQFEIMRSSLSGYGCVSDPVQTENRSFVIGHRMKGRDGDRLLGIDAPLDERPSHLAISDREFIKNLRGPFALAIFDPVKRSLVLARNPSGGRPLYVYEAEKFIAFASVPGALLSFTGGELDLALLATGLRGRSGPGGSCLWAGIRPVRPGTIETLSYRASHIEPIFPAVRQRVEKLVASDENELSAKLDRAVALSLNSTGKAAISLSSGLDSNAVLASALRCKEASRIVAVTAAPHLGHPQACGRHRFCDEAERAARAASYYGVKHVVVRDRSRIISSIRGASNFYQGPVPNALNEGWIAGIGEAAQDYGADVMIDATNGNASLTFGGIDLLPDWLRQGRPAAWAIQMFMARGIPDVRLRGLAFNSLNPWIPKRLNNWLLHRVRGASDLGRISYVRRDLPDIASPAAASDSISVRMQMMENYDQGMNNAALEARTGISHRDPTGDQGLIDFTLGLPLEAFLDRGITRPLFKRAMAGRIPDFILHEPLRGFQGADFYGRLSQKEANDALDELEPCHEAVDLLDFQRMRRDVANWPAFDSSSFGSLFGFFRNLTDSLSVAYFLLERSELSGLGSTRLHQAKDFTKQHPIPS